jgi:hypothetical protein
MAISRNEVVIVEFRFAPEERSVVMMTQSQEAELSRRGRLTARDAGVAPEYVLTLPEDVYFAGWETPREYAYVISNDGKRARVLFQPEGNAIPAVMVLAQDREAKQGEGVRTRYYTIEVLRTTGLTVSTRGWKQRDAETSGGMATQQPPPLAGRRDENFRRYVRMIREGVQ